jgi:isocitrate/isopropylmalate dehydrogenase
VSGQIAGPLHRIAVMPGDGVGPELVGQAERVLEATAELEPFGYELVRYPHSGSYYRTTGVLLDPAAFDDLQACDSLLFGAAGDPDLPIGTMEKALIVELSARLGLSVGIRPIKLHAEWLSPLKAAAALDIVIVRDTTEGELAIPGGSLHSGTPFEATASIVMHTRHGVDRALSHGFELARRRRRRVAVVAQANALGAHRIWHERAVEMARYYPDVELELLYPDAAAMDLIRSPARFDVIVTTIMIGGILTDLAAALVGGIGLVASSRINPSSGFGMFEPAHGSAPKYTGTGQVCPIATIEAVAMLLDHLGEMEASKRIHVAVSEALSSREILDVSTASQLGTAGATDVVLHRIVGAAR